MVDLCNSEFLSILIHQSTNERDHYKPVFHRRLQVGEIVLLRDPLLKPACYPMGIVREVTVNVLQETTCVVVFMG